MNCHMCGERRATIHLLELIDGQQKSVWLCSICASGRPDIPRLDPADGIKAGESPTLASFLGQSYAGDQQAVAAPPCPECGYRIAAFQERNRLGCPGCYPHFRRQIAPIVARFHRHASHVGRVPRRAGGHATRQGEMTRVRVALEKAIRAEDYEEAARLRDTLRRQTAEADAEGREPGGSRGA